MESGVTVAAAGVDHTLVNRVGGLGREELKRDRARECSESIGDGRTASSRWRTNALNES
jgi:hypothetical protein